MQGIVWWVKVRWREGEKTKKEYILGPIFLMLELEILALLDCISLPIVLAIA